MRGGVGAVAVAGEPVVGVPAAPYRGIHPFRYADHAIFFARDEETRMLASLAAVYRGVFLYGDSGSGKSSLVNAALLPRADRLGFSPVRLRVQPRAGEELVIEPIVRSDDDTDVLPCVLAPESDGSRVVLSIADFEARVRAATQLHRPVLVFDQFEEILTLFEGPDAIQSRRVLAAMIVRLVREPMPVKLVFVFREDYLGRIKHLLAACPELVDQALRLGAPSADDLQAIIRGPFERFPGRFGRELGPELAQRLGAALAERFGIGEVSLSEVQTVCLRLWQSPDPAALLAEKGVQGILEDDLGEALDALPTELRAAAVALLGQMVTSAGTRNVISADDLRRHVQEEDETISSRLLDEALDRLERDSKLVRRERRHDLYLYEITSEFLVPWISRRREELRVDQERARERRRLRVLGSIAGGLLILVALVAALALWALGQRADAKRQASTSTSRELAARAANLLNADPGLSLVLARKAVSIKPTEQAANALRQAVLGFRGLGVIRAGRGLYDADLSPDRGRAVSASKDGRVRVWDVRTGRAIMNVKAHRGEARAARFSPDGRLIVSAGFDGAVVITRVATGRHRVVIRNPGVKAFSVAFARRGDLVASAYVDGTVRTAAVHGSRRVRVLRGRQGPLLGVALSDDSTRVAGAGANGTVQVWHLRGEHPRVVVLRGPRAVLSNVSFRPRHAALIGSDEQGSVWFWNATTGVQEGRVRADKQAIFAARFSPDGRRFATAGEDGAVRIFDATSRREMAVLNGHTGRVVDVNFSVKGNQVISTGYDDGTIRTWDPGTTRVLREPATNASISSDGRLVVAGGNDGNVRIWRVASGRIEATLRGHTRRSYAWFSPDDRQVVSVSEDGTVRVWGVADAKQRHVFRDHGDMPVYAAAFDHDGKRIVSAGETGRIVVRRLTGGPPVIRTGHRGAVNDVSFSPDDRQLLSAGDDGTIRIWDARRVAPPIHVLSGHFGAVTTATFSRDAQKVLSTGIDGTVRVWSVHGGHPVILRGHEGTVESAAFSPTGNRIVSSGVDGSVRLWDSHGGEPLVTLHQYHGRAWSAGFSPNGANVISSGDNTIWLAPCEVCGTTAGVLKLARARVGRRLSNVERERFLQTP